jgi:amino acid transporter
VHPRTQTPVTATILVTSVITALAIAFPIATLAESTASITLVTFTLANLSLILVKRKDPAPAGVVIVPGWIPVVGATLSGVFLYIEFVRRVL